MDIREQSRRAAAELLEKARLLPGDLFVVGCSSSEILGGTIGRASSLETAQAVLDGIYPLLREQGVFLAAQCCEHLNRALILEEEAAIRYALPMVNAVPKLKAGGSFSAAAWNSLVCPCAVESIQAHAGIDIGDTLIGMHLRPVAVPVRTQIRQIGSAHVVCARTRLKYIGGERTSYRR